MEVILPEGRFVQPVLDRITKDALGLLINEREDEGLSVCLPNNPLNGIDEITETLLRGLGLGARRALTCQQSLALFLRPPAFGHVHDCSHKPASPSRLILQGSAGNSGIKF